MIYCTVKKLVDLLQVSLKIIICSSLWSICYDLLAFQFTAMCMMTSPNGNIFHVTGPLCEEFTGHPWIPAQRPVTQSFDVFFDLCLHQQLSKQLRCRWFETPSHSLWHHCNVAFWASFQYMKLVFPGMAIPIFKIKYSVNGICVFILTLNMLHCFKEIKQVWYWPQKPVYPSPASDDYKLQFNSLIFVYIFDISE